MRNYKQVLTMPVYNTDYVLSSEIITPLYLNFVLFQLTLNNRLAGWITALGVYRLTERSNALIEKVTIGFSTGFFFFF